MILSYGSMTSESKLTAPIKRFWWIACTNSDSHNYYHTICNPIIFAPIQFRIESLCSRSTFPFGSVFIMIFFVPIKTGSFARCFLLWLDLVKLIHLFSCPKLLVHHQHVQHDILLLVIILLVWF
jgi:hypothetical protein